MRDGEIELDSGCAGRRSNDGRLLLADNLSDRRVDGCLYLEGSFARRQVVKEHRGGDPRFLPSDGISDALTPDQSVAVDCEPNVAYQATIVPPVVPNTVTFPQSKCEPGYGLRRRTIIKFDSQKVVAWTQGRRYIKPVGCMSSLMGSQKLAVKP